MSYNSFSYYYDSLTENVDYKKRAEYFNDLIQKYSQIPVGVILDIACGTASLTCELADMGYTIIATDNSQQMLEIASSKIDPSNTTLLLQPMQQLNVGIMVDAAICTLDSINHLPDESALIETFSNLSKIIKTGGVFAFDVNTLYKHKYILADNCYSFETEDVFCCWQNSFNPENNSTDIFLDFFVPQDDGSYIRECEDFTERFFSYHQIKNALELCGFKLAAIWGEDSFSHAVFKQERLIYVAIKFN